LPRSKRDGACGEPTSASCSFPLGICNSWQKRLRNWGGVVGVKAWKRERKQQSILSSHTKCSSPDPEERYAPEERSTPVTFSPEAFA